MIRTTYRIAFIISFLTLLFIAILFTLIQSCKKLEFERTIRLKTGEVYNISRNSATITGIILDIGENGIAQYGHCWSTDSNPIWYLETKTSFGKRSDTGSFNSDLSELITSTIYYIRAYAISSDGITFYGDNVSFRTGDLSLPTLYTLQPSNITDSSATCGGNITSDGGTSIVARGICWSTSNNPDLTDDYTNEGMGTGTFTSNMKGLCSSTKYYVRAYAINNFGTSYGNELNFTTLSIISWDKVLGGSDDENAHYVEQTNDGGYIVAGYSESDDGDVTGNHGGMDFWIVKLSSTGDTEWQKALGGSEDEQGWSIQQTTDGGYITTGYSHSNDGDVSGNHGSSDYWIVKITSIGNIEWQKSFGGSDIESATSIQQTTDEGYVIAGYAHSEDGDVSENKGLADYWVVKLDSAGNLEWEKSFGGSGEDQAWFVQQTMDKGYIITGHSNSSDGDVTVNLGSDDYWIVKIDSIGNIDWQKSFGGQYKNRARSVRQTDDGGYIIAGESFSYVDDPPGYNGFIDYLIVKLNSSGDIEWQKVYGGSNDDLAKSIQKTSDDGYVIAGWSKSNDRDVFGNHGGMDYWIVKITSTGGIVWQKSLGGSLDDKPLYIKQANDGGYIIAGWSESNDKDVSGNHGGSDYWIVKIPGQW
jgi:hypothetical protein